MWIISDMIGYLAMDIIRSVFCMTKATWFTNLIRTCSMKYDFLKFLFVVLFFNAFVLTIWSVRSLINRRLSMSMTSVIRFVYLSNQDLIDDVRICIVTFPCVKRETVQSTYVTTRSCCIAIQTISMIFEGNWCFSSSVLVSSSSVLVSHSPLRI